MRKKRTRIKRKRKFVVLGPMVRERMLREGAVKTTTTMTMTMTMKMMNEKTVTNSLVMMALKDVARAQQCWSYCF